MDNNFEMAMCGCRCDLCKAHAPNVEKNDQRKTLAEMWNKYYGLDPSIMGVCGGCRSNPSDENCPVRKCVLDKGLNHCGDCGDFPCDIFYQRCGSFSEEKKNNFDMDEYNEYILAYDNETRLKEYKSKRERLQKVSEETMRFMRGKYALDEVGDGKDKLEFRENGETFLTIRIHKDRYDFQIDDKRVPVADLETLETVKPMIVSKKGPNRKPFPKEQSVYADCGYRCDMCVHFTGGTISDESRVDLKERLNRIYGAADYWGDNMPFCNGCATDGCMVSSPNALCSKHKCMANNSVDKCKDCSQYPCYNESTHKFYQIHSMRISADDVTKAILCYIPGQYGN